MPQPTTKVATSHQHIQTTPGLTWVIVHSLGMYPAVDVYIDYQGEKHKILPLSVVYDNPNQVTVTFSSPRTGIAMVA